MSTTIPDSTLVKFTTFGDLLRFLRRRAGITQLELATAVGYSDGQISRLEQNLRPPDIPTLEARFVSALYLENEKAAVARLLDLAAKIRREDSPAFGVCPYKGLNYFDENDAELFVGRESVVSELTEIVLSFSSPKDATASRFLAIVGASGSGKSSLVRAGLMPSLRWDKRTTGWQFRLMTPTARPLENLAGELAGGGSAATTAALLDSMVVEPRSLHFQAQRLAKDANGSHLLLAVDQFEELFSLCRSEDERREFIDNLLEAASARAGPTIVVIVLRADFYASCAAYAQLRDALSRQQRYIGAMSTEELRRAIEEPARRGHWEIEPGLVDLLLHEVGDEPGALPLLSHVLVETWQRRRGRTMTLGGYTSSGGVRGAISETAESVYMDSMTQEQQRIAREIFLRLTELGDEHAAADTRRRATFAELGLGHSNGEDVKLVLRALADARLISLGEDSAEVAHEALIREWPRLRSWLQDNRESLRLQRQLSDAAKDWARFHYDSEALYRGVRLAQAREWAMANPTDMNSLDRQFLAASMEAAEREVSAKEAQRQHDLELAQDLARAEKARAEVEVRSVHRLRLRNRALTVIGILAITLALLAGWLGAQARHNLVRAESLRLAGDANLVLAEDGDPQIATLLSIQALEKAYSAQADAALSSSISDIGIRLILRGHTGSIYSVAFSPDGKYALTGSQDGTAILWDIRNAHQIRVFRGHKGGISAVAYSPDGKSILTGGNDGTVRLWNAANGQELSVLSGQFGGVTSVTFSPDGHQVLAAGGNGILQLWDSASGKALAVFIAQGDLFSDAAFSPDGRSVIASSYDGTAWLWDIQSAKSIGRFSNGAHAGRLTSVAFSPDGRSVIVGSEDHAAWIWESGTAHTICTLVEPAGSVNDVAYSPNGEYVATAGKDGTVRLWDAHSCQEARHYSFLGMIKRVAFSPNGRLLLAGGENGLGLLLATPAGGILRLLPHISRAASGFSVESPSGSVISLNGGVNSVAFSPDGRTVLTGGDDRIARLWDASTGTELRAFVGHTMRINSVAFSPDGKYILTGSQDQMAVLWNAETGEQVRSVLAQETGVNTVAFLPDGRTFLTTGTGPISSDRRGQTRLWDVATGREIRTLNFGMGMEPDMLANAMVISPDGREALVRGWFGEAILFSLVTGKQICDFGPLLSLVTSVAISPDGKMAITGNEDSTARLWSTRMCKLLRTFHLGPGSIISLAFSPNGQSILTGQDDNNARLWDINSGELLREFTGHTSWVTSVAFSPDGRSVATGSEDGTARVWDADYHDTIRFACSLLWRDLTADERAQYGITDAHPSCTP